MNEELDSQLSAMFDDELLPAECELLARRLSRDEHLKARWGRYAIIGAVMRAERGVRLNAPLAGRVNAVLLAEPALAAHTAPRDRNHARLRWWQPLAGAAVAAGVATVSIMWLRAQAPLSATPLVTQITAPGRPTAATPAGPGQGDSYIVPRPRPAAALVPSTELANYVVAHSMFSSPVARRNLLSAFMTSESPAAGAQETKNDAKAIAH